MMGTIISLSTPNLDWDVLARMVERNGNPVWLELDGNLQGVLLPRIDVQRLMGHYTQSVKQIADSHPLPSTQREDERL